MANGDSEMLLLAGCSARVEWRRSQKARRISLRIDPRGGGVVVTLPPRASRRAGMALVTNHADWIAQRLAALPEAIKFVHGAAVPLDDVAHPIAHVPHRTGGVWIEEGRIMVSGEAQFVSRRVADFLRAEARRRLSALVQQKAAQAGLRPSRVAVKDTRSRWGSCAASRNLSFSWRLVMAPPFVQDYVVAHEVAHLAHMNHGPQFWAKVGTLSPHTEPAMAWLNTHGSRLLRIG